MYIQLCNKIISLKHILCIQTCKVLICIQTCKLLINDNLHNIEEISNAIKKSTNPKHIGFRMRKILTTPYANAKMMRSWGKTYTVQQGNYTLIYNYTIICMNLT